MKNHFLLALIVIFTSLPGWMRATDEYTLLKIGYAQGLSNSAVLSLYQDNQGFMWFGTYDGLNNYDSRTMNVYRADGAAGKQLINNIINDVDGADDDCLWISTNTGINRFSLKKRCVTGVYEQFSDVASLLSNRKGATWVLDKGEIYYYNASLHRFMKVDRREKSFNPKLSFVDDKGYLWIFSSGDNSVYRCHIDDFTKEEPAFSTIRTNIHQKKIEYTFYQNGILNFIDEDKDLFLFDITRNTKVYIRNVGDLTAKYGEIKGVISFYDDIVIGFIQNGLVKLDAATRYSESVIDRSIRIFSIYKDPVQDIIWIGTDGQGVMTYSKKHALATQLMFSQLQGKVIRQVRSIHTDDKGDLWFGTKGDGLVRVEKYAECVSGHFPLSSISVYFPGRKENVREYDRKLMEYQVFGIVPSRYMKGFWIGSAENPGLSYYDYGRDAVIPLGGDTEILQKVHRIYEENDTTLWLTTSGNGLCKVNLEKKNGAISARSIRQFIFKDGQKEVNDFFPMAVEDDSVMWLGSRGMGLVKFNFKTGDYEVCALGGKENPSINDILSIYRKGDVFYLGTVSGLVRVEFDAKGKPAVFCIGKEQGFLNDMVHGILEDENGFLWLSTNKGLVKYNPENNAFHTYYYSNGLQIGEFSDDAFYRCPYTGNLFFGGIDGLLYLEKEGMNEAEYHPDVRFRDLTLGVEPVNFYDYYDETANTLLLSGVSLSFSVSFVAPDYVEGDNFEYSWLLEGGNEEWSPFALDNVAAFKSLHCGDYTLKVRYKKDVFDAEYKFYSLHIRIRPPWYLSSWAYAVYVMLLIAIGTYAVYLARTYYRREKLIKELMLHESHNAAVSSISRQFHEAVGSFATIYRMCGQLRRFDAMPDEYYRMLDVIHETVLSFAFKADDVWNEPLPVEGYLPGEMLVHDEVRLKELSDEVIRMLMHKGDGNPSNLQVDMAEELAVLLPGNALRYLLYYLYKESAGVGMPVSVSGKTDGNLLILKLTLDNETAERLADVGNGAEESAATASDFTAHLYKWLYVYAMKMMKGSGRCEGNEFCVTLPLQPGRELPAPVQGGKTVLLLEDKAGIAWLVSDILSGEYVVHCVNTVQAAFGYLRKNTPDVFLADTMIYLKEENKFIEYVQVNKGLLMKTAFIPMLTWKAAFLLQKDFNKLVDGFVVMPYNILFLKEIVDMAVRRRWVKEESLLVDMPGQKEKDLICETAEQANFAKQLIRVLDNNLDKEDLSTTFIAEQMNISPRQYYRKFKEISTLSSTDFVKNYRIEKAASLLLETDWSVQKVISEVGIQSRSYFYKEFTSRYGVTPKTYKKTKLGQDVAEDEDRDEDSEP